MLFEAFTFMATEDPDGQLLILGLVSLVLLVVGSITMLGLAFVFYRWLFRTVFRR